MFNYPWIPPSSCPSCRREKFHTVPLFHPRVSHSRRGFLHLETVVCGRYGFTIPANCGESSLISPRTTSGPLSLEIVESSFCAFYTEFKEAVSARRLANYRRVREEHRSSRLKRFLFEAHALVLPYLSLLVVEYHSWGDLNLFCHLYYYHEIRR